ncbi:hypothetical protein RZS28_13605 [Methylocapsa polymorpha]|uniref:Uncharacterized protein n=1 Tax=Methylocapsa polymorpha TaxID=3080828 RepID=A0ABZ0HPU5_9HYPH|nr:hypothetical protein RZS28_13605 [Methylocapsa sp. RX1]
MLPEFPLEGLASQAFSEFSEAADYYWKSARLIDSELKSEALKLSDYYPLSGEEKADRIAIKLRKFRWTREHRKLTGVFPYLIAAGNLFSCVSLFEVF